LFSNGIDKQATNEQKDDQRSSKYVQFCARTIANLIHVNSPGGSFGTLKIKTLIIHLCSIIISDSVAVEIFAIG